MFGRLWKVQAADYLVNLRVVFSMCGKISISRKTQIGRKRSTEVGFIEVTWHQLHTGGVGFLHPKSNLAPKQENNWDQNFLFETAPSVKVVDMKKITRKPFYEFNLTLVKDAFLERQRPHLKLYSLDCTHKPVFDLLLPTFSYLYPKEGFVQRNWSLCVQ